MEIMKRRVLAAFLAMILTCGVAFPGNAVYAAEVTETTVESDAAVEETAVQTTDAEAEAKPEGSAEAISFRQRRKKVIRITLFL